MRKIIREEHVDYLRPDRTGRLSEVTFTTEVDGEEISARARYDGRRGEWEVRPNGLSSWYTADEADAKAAVLTRAADEIRGLNAFELGQRP